MLAALVAACVLPAVIAAGLLLYQDYRLQRDRLYRQELLLAQGAVAEIDRELGRIGAVMESLATSRELANGQLADFHDRASQTLSAGLVDNYALVTRNGRQLLNTLQPYGAPLPRAHVGPDLARVAGLLRRHSLPEGWVATVVDGHGTIVARSLDNARFVGSPAQPELVEAILGRREGVFDARTREGFEVVTAFSRSMVADWSVAVGAPQAEVTRQLYRSMGIAALGVAAAIGLGMTVALGWARRLTQSVQGLIEPALALGRGELVSAPHTGLKEADAVGVVLEQASKMLAHAQHLAHTDALTGLSNRLLFEALAHRQLIDDQRNGQRRVLLALDLDGFKQVNDQHGHAVGDEVLKLAAQRIVGSLRSADVPARLGGDEFVVLLSDTAPDGAATVAEKLVRALSEPYPGVRHPVSASVGIAVAPAAGATVADLMRRADEALYEAKRAGKRRWVART